MAIWTNTPARPNQQLQAGATDALALPKFNGMVEGTIKRNSVLKGWISMEQARGTNQVVKKAIGEATIGVITPGEAPDGAAADFSKVSVKVEKHVLSRTIIAELELFHTDFAVQSEVANEQGKKLAKLYDSSMFIQLCKAGMATTSPYGAVDGFSGGTQVTFASAGDELDPAKLYAKIGDLVAGMAAKDVNAALEGLRLFARPSVINTLLQAEQIVNGQYLDADGNMKNGYTLSAWGMPVIATNDIPNGVVASHVLGSAYDGDFSNVVALVCSPRAVFAAETIGLTSEVFRHPIDKQTYIDTHCAYAATPDRVEFAGVLLKA